MLARCSLGARSVLARCSLGACTVLARCSHGVRSVLARCSHGARSVLARCSHGARSVLARCSHGARSVLTRFTRTIYYRKPAHLECFRSILTYLLLVADHRDTYVADSQKMYPNSYRFGSKERIRRSAAAGAQRQERSGRRAAAGVQRQERSGRSAAAVAQTVLMKSEPGHSQISVNGNRIPFCSVKQYYHSVFIVT